VTAAELAAWLAAQEVSEANLKPVLRQLKQRAYARIAARDLGGLAPLGEVVECMTLIAELAVGKAVEVLGRGLQSATARRAAPTGRAQELIVIGMGKLGGRELNVSSDIDLIFVYPEDGDTDGARVDFQFRVFHPPWARPDQCHRRRHRRRPGVSASTCACGPTAIPARWCVPSTCWRTTSSPRAASGNAMPGSRRGR
jgi:hypothetical protein